MITNQIIKCIILDDYQRVALRYFNLNSTLGSDKVSVECLHEPIVGKENLVRKLEPYDIIIAMRERTPFPKELLGKLPNLKLLITSGMRNLAIDVPFAQSKGIVVSGTSSYKEPPTELAWALILNLARHVAKESNSFRAGGPWQSTLGTTLHGKTLSLLGLGKIGQKMARIGNAFGMNVMAWSQNLTEERCRQLDVEFAGSKANLLANADFLSIHLVLSERSRNLVKLADLIAMKPSAYLINTSRAAIVNQSDLLHVLDQGVIAGAGLDVFEEEPLPLDHPFRSRTNILATPHLGYVADKNYAAYFGEAVENIEAFLNNQPIRLLS